MRRSIPLLLAAVCSLPVTGLFVASAAAPVARKVSRVFVEQPKVARGRHTSGRQLDPRLAAVAVSALRRFVDDAADPTDIDLAVRKRMSKFSHARKTAKRLLARFDKLPTSTRTRTFGTDQATRQRVAQADVLKLAPTRMQKAWQLTMATVALPAEGLDKPTEVSLVLAGVSSTNARDADGSDEVLVIVDRFVGDELAQTGTMPTNGTVALAGGATVAGGQTIFTGGDENAMLISAVIEDDNGSSATARDEYRVMIELARGLADSLAGSTPAERFEAALETSAGLLEVSKPEVFPHGSITWSSVGYDGTSLIDAYAIPASKTGGVTWKLRHDHTFGNGTYEVLFDVPGPPPPELKTIKVKIVSAKSLTDKEREPEREYHSSSDTTGTQLPKTEYDLWLRIEIRDEYSLWSFPDNDSTPAAGFSFTRVVLPGKVHIELELGDLGAQVDGCGYSWSGGSCILNETLDLVPGTGRVAKLKYDPATKTISGAVTGQAGEELVLKGDSTTEINGKVVIVVSHE